MREGTKKLYCYRCAKLIGYEIPEGKYFWGIIEVEEDGERKPITLIKDTTIHRNYLCVDCQKELDSVRL